MPQILKIYHARPIFELRIYLLWIGGSFPKHWVQSKQFNQRKQKQKRPRTYLLVLSHQLAQLQAAAAGSSRKQQAPWLRHEDNIEQQILGSQAGKDELTGLLQRSLGSSMCSAIATLLYQHTYPIEGALKGGNQKVSKGFSTSIKFAISPPLVCHFRFLSKPCKFSQVASRFFVRVERTSACLGTTWTFV